MSAATTSETLNQILATIYRSLPIYLTSAVPWTSDASSSVAKTIRGIADEQQALVNRLADAVLKNGSVPELGNFPIDYTGLHDLSVRYMLGELVREQERTVSAIESTLSQSALNGNSRSLGEESLSKSRSHLDTLKRLVAETSSSRD